MYKCLDKRSFMSSATVQQFLEEKEQKKKYTTTERETHSTHIQVFLNNFVSVFLFAPV